MQSSLIEAIRGHIGESVGVPFQGQHEGDVSGGCISRAIRLSDEQCSYFVKLNQASQLGMFQAEMAGLRAMAATGMPVPKAICCGSAQGKAYLVLEWLTLSGRGDWAEMGRALAEMHLCEGPRRFGFETDNFIGATPQVNTWEDDWAPFFIKHRLGYQLQLAESRGGRFPRAQSFLQLAAEVLGDHVVKPAVVHGDLWSGNASFTATGPVIFDPACYYGDGEVDLAMTRLFGGFPPSFYEGYAAVKPDAPGASLRSQIYNTYHLLNHYNLFGGHYQQEANNTMDDLLALAC